MLFLILTAVALAGQLIGIGDLHGDYDKAIAVLQLAGVATDDGNWSGADTVVVQLGDIYDRGPDGTKILRLFRNLKAQAKTQGGDVITIMGNHELMNLQGVQAYVHPDEYLPFNSKKDRRAAFQVQGEMGQFLRQSPTMALVNGTMFVHGGMTKELAKLGITRLKSEINSAISTENWNSPLLGPSGPLWTREMVSQALRGECAMVDSVLSELLKVGDQVNRIVVGHTIQGGGKIGIHCNGRLVATDVAMSRYIINKKFLAFANLTSSIATGVYGSK